MAKTILSGYPYKIKVKEVYSEDFTRLTTWADRNCKGWEYEYQGAFSYTFYFKHEKDAIMFSLIQLS